MRVLQTAKFSIDDAAFATLKRRLETLPGKVQKKIERGVFRKMSAPFVKAIRANVLGATKTKQRKRGKDFGSLPGSFKGRLKRSIVRRFKSYRGGKSNIEVVGPSWPLGAHGHLVELGTVGMRPHPRTGTSGRMTKHPFMLPAFVRTKGTMESIRNRSLGELIEKEAVRG